MKTELDLELSACKNEYLLDVGKTEERKEDALEILSLTWFKNLHCIHSLDLLLTPCSSFIFSPT